MAWKPIVVIKLENYWKFTPEIEGRFFRLRHIDSPKAPMGWVGQAESIINTNFHQFFQLQRLNGLSVYEIAEFIKPPIFAARRLGFRQQAQIPNNWLIEVEISLMPIVDLNPDQPIANPTIATAKNVISVSVGPAAATAVKLLPVNIVNSRKHATFYNPSTTRNLYIDTDSNINTASAIAKVAPGKVYVSDVPAWQGEYWGMVDGTGTTATSVVVEEYI